MQSYHKGENGRMTNPQILHTEATINSVTFQVSVKNCIEIASYFSLLFFFLCDVFLQWLDGKEILKDKYHKMNEIAVGNDSLECISK